MGVGSAVMRIPDLLLRVLAKSTARANRLSFEGF